MLLKLIDNRVRRSYNSSGIIDKYTEKMPLNYPEDWICSVVEAFNPNFEKVENEVLSKLENGEFLKDYIKNNQHILGEKKDISILTKLLDAGERLVIQVHPTDEFANKFFNSSCGKTECWFVVDAKEDASVYIGFKERITKEKWKDAFDRQDIGLMLSMLHKINVSPGDCIFVAGGMPHAIGEGCFIIELQQASDLMVISEKTTLSGIVLDERKIHGGLGFEKMFDCFEYVGESKEKIKEKCFINHHKAFNEIIPIIDKKVTDKFGLDVIYVKDKFELNAQKNYSILVVFDGEGVLKDNKNTFNVTKGNKFLVEANTKIDIFSEKEISVCILKP